jgi:hypothetical protein
MIMEHWVWTLAQKMCTGSTQMLGQFGKEKWVTLMQI